MQITSKVLSCLQVRLLLDRKELYQLVEDALEYQWNKDTNRLTLIKNLLKESNGYLSEKELVADVLTLFTIGLQVTWAGQLKSPNVLNGSFYLVVLYRK